MLPSHKGSIHLFRFQGIDVWLHWSWFIFALYRINISGAFYSSYIWSVWQYLALFAIVVFHEFGHALACRSVGGRADEIVLWPLGGVAYVDPPKRPGATLWSIAAGPLVNVLLVPIFSVCWFFANRGNLEFTQPDLYHLVVNVWVINLVLLCFNMLPIFPLDGGQILGALLWYWVGRARSLRIVSTIGIVAAGSLLLLAIMVPSFRQNPWLMVIAVFALFQSWSGLQYARQLVRLEAAPRHAGLACPTCGAAPRVGDFWTCGRCRRPFDIFGNQGVCPACGAKFDLVRCSECGQTHPIHAFVRGQG
jgi:Zn-dependent protease